MKTFMLVLRDRPGEFRELPPEEMQRIIGLYRAWAQKMEALGRLAGGHKLHDEGGQVLRRVDGRLTVKDGPFAETKEVVSGYFLIRAKDYAEVLELCRDHPHLSFEGEPIEVREVDLLESVGD
ncbi:MAG: transcription initiation protein [Planctomycetes bacterium]|nr:transcription initiation protein [Planctomycetota bacterium]